jgi:hypothetical protein
METLETIWRKTDRYLRLVWQLVRYQDISLSEHLEILDAVLARDRRAAKRLTRAHIESAGARHFARLGLSESASIAWKNFSLLPQPLWLSSVGLFNGKSDFKGRC